MKKHNPTVEHILNKEFDDACSDSDIRTRSNIVTEYGFRYHRRDGGFDFISQLIYADAFERMNFVWIPDTNLAINKKASGVWSSLMRAYCLDFQTQCVMVGPVFNELKEWLFDPRRNMQLASDIRRCLKSKVGFLRLFSWFDFGEEYQVLAQHYLDLLSMRRYLAVPLGDNQHCNGFETADKSYVLSKITDDHGQRSKMFARSGRDDFDKNGDVNVNDEAIVLTSFFYGLLNNVNTCIVTTDSHLLDIFYKLQWFIDTHYRTWLAAQLVSEGEYGKPTKIKTEGTDFFFEGECELYKKKSSVFDEVMKFRSEYYSFEIMHIQPDGQINIMRFKWELGVKEMLQTKRLAGKNSSVFGDRNIHIATGPVNGIGDHIIVGKDKVVHPRRENPLPVSLLEAQHAIHSQERFSSSINPVGQFRSEN